MGPPVERAWANTFYARATRAHHTTREMRSMLCHESWLSGWNIMALIGDAMDTVKIIEDRIPTSVRTCTWAPRQPLDCAPNL